MLIKPQKKINNVFLFSSIGSEKLIINPKINPEIIEIKNHPWFVAVQFHPEFKSRPLAPHPLFCSFIKAAKNY